MSTINGVPAEIIWDSGVTEGNPKEGPYANVKFKCLASNRYALKAALLGTSTASGSTITRTYPFAYPPSPSLIARSIDSITFVGPPTPIVGSGAPWITGKYAILTTRFEPAWFFDNASDPSGKPYTSTSINMSAQCITLPTSTYTFPSGAPTNTPVARLFPQIQISMKRFMLPYLPINEMASVLGKVNSGVFQVGQLACPAETVLFTGGPSEFTADTSGNKTYTVEYQFIYQAVGWNKALSPNPTEGYAIPVDGNGNRIYESASFSVLP